MQTRRIFLESLVAAGSLPAVLRVAKAQTYPAKPVRIICGFSPGGVNDIYARLIGQRLSSDLVNRSSSKTGQAPAAQLRLTPLCVRHRTAIRFSSPAQMTFMPRACISI